MSSEVEDNGVEATCREFRVEAQKLVSRCLALIEVSARTLHDEQEFGVVETLRPISQEIVDFVNGYDGLLACGDSRIAVFFHDVRNALIIVSGVVDLAVTWAEHSNIAKCEESLSLALRKDRLILARISDRITSFERMVSRLKETFPKASISLTCAQDGIKMSTEDLYAVLSNLLENAGRAGTGEIIVAGLVRGEVFEFSVVNLCARLAVDPFVLAKRGRELGAGHGYGLGCSRALCEEAGGSLVWDGTFSDGVRIVGRIPLAKNKPGGNPERSGEQWKEQTVDKGGVDEEGQKAREETRAKVGATLPCREE